MRFSFKRTPSALSASNEISGVDENDNKSSWTKRELIFANSTVVSINKKGLPNNDHHKIQNIPAVSQVCILMKKKSTGDDLRCSLDAVNYDEVLLRFFLKKINENVLRITRT